MAGRLKKGRRGARRLVFALLLLLVLLAHGLLGRELRQLRQGWSEVAPMPPRLQVAFVRELAPQAPPPRKAPAPAAPAARPTAPRPVAAAPASVPASVPAPSPASAPETPPAPAAASAAAPSPDAVLAIAPASAPASAPAPVASAASAAAADEPGPEWPASTQLSYQLNGNYRGEVSGSAQVQWIRQGRRYQVHLDVLIGPAFAPLIARRMSSDGLLTAQGIAPRRYDEDTKVMFRERRRVSVLFEGGDGPQGQVLRLADGKPQPAPPGVQDASSQFVHLTWLFLTGRETMAPGRVVELPLALPRKLYRWRYEVLGEEELATPMGPLAAWHLRPQFLTGGGEAAGGDLRAEVWLAPTLQYLPVRLRIVQDEKTYIDLLLKSAPLQAKAP